jgi:predicted DNA-binding ribbon-helix-helix protein
MLRVKPRQDHKGMTAMKSPIVKHSVIIRGHKTSVSLEREFWTALKEVSEQRGITMTYLVSTIDAERKHANLSSAIRLFVLDYYRGLVVAAAEPAAATTKQPYLPAPAQVL